MTTDFRVLCAKVLAYNEGQGVYNFSHLNAHDRDNAAFDAWQEIKAELKSALTEPEPEGPSDEEIMKLMPQLMRDDLAAAARAMLGLDCDDIKVRAPAFRSILNIFNRHSVDHVRAVLARWGDHPGSPDSSTPQPIPVSERLPESEDCDAEGRCWLSTTETEPGWVLDYPERCTNYTHWLPAHALPVPSHD